MKHRADRISVADAVAVIVGIVVGTGIFIAPASVASHVSSREAFVVCWLLGGAISLAGALCYVEMATAFPHAGGDYHYLMLAWGRPPAFLFGWARLAIIQAGTVASLAFAFGDYASQVAPLGPSSPALYAGSAIAALTAAHVLGLREGALTQQLLTWLKVLGVAVIVAVGLAGPVATGAVAEQAVTRGTGLGLAMVFVLYTYGGWNEAGYLSAELFNVRRNMFRALAGSIVAITAIYVLVNVAYLRGLGLAGVQTSEVVADALVRGRWGASGGTFISMVIAISALGATSAGVFTGARTNFALGRDFPLFRFMGTWDARHATPRTALLVQAAVALALVALGSATRQGFTTMVEYTAPAFWIFLSLSGLSLFVLRRRRPDTERPFHAPGYPWVPAVFVIASMAMSYASFRYAASLEGWGARWGLVVLAAGVPLWLIDRALARRALRAPLHGGPRRV
jgi:amino acid transporter